MSACFVYVTVETRDEARAIGRAVVEARLAACANVIGAIDSVYWWQGEVQEATEAALVMKTRAALVERLVAKVKELHSYDCPCVVALPIEAGNADFLAWIDAETSAA